jgi:hypothetical protein
MGRKEQVLMSYGLGVDLGTTFTAAAGGNAQY